MAMQRMVQSRVPSCRKIFIGSFAAKGRSRILFYWRFHCKPQSVCHDQNLPCFGGWSGGVALCFGGLGFTGSDPRCGPTHRSSSHAVAASHIQNRGLAQILAQQQSSSSKKGGLATDVSSGPVFLTRKIKCSMFYFSCQDENLVFEEFARQNLKDAGEMEERKKHQAAAVDE